jgi:hypothetical protein
MMAFEGLCQSPRRATSLRVIITYTAYMYNRQFIVMFFHIFLDKCIVLTINTLSPRLLVPLEPTDLRVFNDLIDDFTKSDFKSFWDNFEIFKIILKYGDLI